MSRHRDSYVTGDRPISGKRRHSTGEVMDLTVEVLAGDIATAATVRQHPLLHYARQSQQRTLPRMSADLLQLQLSWNNAISPD